MRLVIAIAFAAAAVGFWLVLTHRFDLFIGYIYYNGAAQSAQQTNLDVAQRGKHYEYANDQFSESPSGDIQIGDAGAQKRWVTFTRRGGNAKTGGYIFFPLEDQTAVAIKKTIGIDFDNTFTVKQLSTYWWYFESNEE